MNLQKWIPALVLALALLTGCAAPAEPVTQAPEPELTLETEITAVPETPEPPRTTEAPTEAAQIREPFSVTVTPVTDDNQTTVTVTTVDEFLAAIAPDTRIVLSGEVFDLSAAGDYGTGQEAFYLWREAHDGPELVITGVTNLTICAEGTDAAGCVVSADPRYANVLNFENCGGIHLTGFIAGHRKEPGACMGGVVCFVNCQDILVEGCGLFGCGTLGVKGYSSKDLQIIRNEIYECSVGGVELTNCRDVNVDGNTFRDLGGPVFRLYDCENITCDGEEAVPFL